ncbi:Glyoxylate/hydroxypyruvate reductase B [Geodia barretti]|nr:Glyoxylate/hydroxypyruvate reductase B [Geodia barretti]
MGQQVSGTTLGIVGMGRIGYEIAKRAVGFEMKVLYHNRHRKSAEEEERVGATYVPTLAGLLGESDYVVLAAPATGDTHHMMSREQFAAMKPTGVFVNISRGTLVDQDALAEALRGGVISAAGLDVTDPEPLPRDHTLLSLPNLTLTPHTGSATLPTRQAMVQMTVDNIKAVLQGQPMVNEVALPSL